MARRSAGMAATQPPPWLSAPGVPRVRRPASPLALPVTSADQLPQQPVGKGSAWGWLGSILIAAIAVLLAILRSASHNPQFKNAIKDTLNRPARQRQIPTTSPRSPGRLHTPPPDGPWDQKP